VIAGFPCKLGHSQVPSGFYDAAVLGPSSVLAPRRSVLSIRLSISSPLQASGRPQFTPDWSTSAEAKSYGGCNSGCDQRALGASCWFPGDSEPSTRACAIANMLRKINNTEAICIGVIVSESICDPMIRADTGAR
jgi:hypothetical protein